ncbi:phage major capsid protein [Devosia sp. Root635]|uniref:phage major capsid family protein n=1 Tax=Devosia sp. Root635 TaxID=1736575 RepID=UPI0006F8910D|nr:phage major capsid protein [Devosia sp. Root635]KRA42105.1 hypothetical protein ASD80_10285 [Devosia sp. Root635]
MEPIFKVLASKGEGMDFILSDGTVDRYGDIVEPSGWDLTNFKNNPIALFGHSSSFPIGSWENVRVEGGKLIGRLKLAARGTSARIDELIGLLEQGILRAVSVGFAPVEWEAIDPKDPWGGSRYTKQQLLECSLVSIPANPSALAKAKALGLSDEIMSLAFGEQADVRRRDVSTPGKHAVSTSKPPKSKGSNMSTLAKRIEDAENELVAKRDKLVELTSSDDIDNDAVESLNGEIETLERTVTNLKASEAKIGVNAVKGAVAAPNVARRPLGFPQKEIAPLDLLVRKAVVRGISHFGEKDMDKVLEERYPGHEATAAIAKAAAPLGTTTGSHFVDDLQQTSYQGFIDALDGKSIFPGLRARGMGMNFDQAGTAYIPGVSAGGANGSFFAEGSPMRVGRITTTSTTMTNRKMGVIIPFSREAAKRSTPNLEQLVRRRIIADTAAILDSHLLDAVAGDSVRPAGLLYGVAATASGYGGGDYEAVINDFKTLLAPFIAANAADGITVIMNPTQGLSLDLMVGPDGKLGDWFGKIGARVSLMESTHATAARLVAVRTEDLATALGDAPDFEISTQATIHMEDSTPLPISAAGSPNTVAAPVRSFFQTDSMGVRMVMDTNWKMVRDGMVSWIDGTTW